MNPASRKNPLDSAKYREQYLSNLRLQASNDQRNQNANMVFRNTGTTPSRPPDTRSTTEKASDFEGMKVDLRSKLTQITDGIIASQIIGELNADQIRFAIDKWGTIEPDMKKLFGTGVPSSPFIAYLNRLIAKFQLTEGVETGLQQATGSNLLMSNTQILYGLPRGQIWKTLGGLLDKARRQFGINVEPVLRAIKTNMDFIPSEPDESSIGQLPAEIRAEIMVIANRIYNNLPSNGEIADIIQEITIGLANRDKVYTEKAIGDLMELVAIEDGMEEDKNEIIQLIEQFKRDQVQEEIFGIEGGIGEAPPPEAEQFFSPPAQPEAEFGVPKKAQTQSEAERVYSQQPRMIDRQEWDALGSRNRNKKALFINARLFMNPDLVLRLTTKGRSTPYQYPKRMADSDKNSNADLDSLYESYLQEMNMGMAGDGLRAKMSGKGLTMVKEQKVLKPYRQSIAHLVDKPVEKVKPYTQFGRYFINKHRLEGEGIVAFRQPSGNTIGTLPTEKVSKSLAKVMRTLVGKGIPSYEDINDLSKEDKFKLHNICHNCKVDSPAIPKMKGEGEQEDDRFNILRGEIIAGNDSKTIAKEFKIMLLKFMNEGRIPRRQANEILQELLALGH